jgi:hypothetical protein
MGSSLPPPTCSLCATNPTRTRRARCLWRRCLRSQHHRSLPCRRHRCHSACARLHGRFQSSPCHLRRSRRRRCRITLRHDPRTAAVLHHRLRHHRSCQSRQLRQICRSHERHHHCSCRLRHHRSQSCPPHHQRSHHRRRHLHRRLRRHPRLRSRPCPHHRQLLGRRGHAQLRRPARRTASLTLRSRRQSVRSSGCASMARRTRQRRLRGGRRRTRRPRGVVRAALWIARPTKTTTRTMQQ